MIHFGVIAPAFSSHFQVLQALASALVDKGHRVTFIHQADTRPFVTDPRIGFEAVGADTHPLGSLAHTIRAAANPGSPWGLRRVIVDLARCTDMLCREVPAAISRLGIDALLCDQMEAAGGLIGDGVGLPYVSIACALPVNREPGVPLPVMPFVWDDTEKSAQMAAQSERIYDWMMTPHRRVIESRAAGFGLSRRGALHECLSPLAQVSQIIPEFDFPRRSLPAQFHYVGPLRPVDTSGPPLAWPIANDRPFVFASLGTVQGYRLDLFKRIAQACRRVDAQLLVGHCGGLNAQQARELEAAGATWVTDYAPQGAALMRADAVVSHGGLNTVLDAMATRTPMLAMPIAFDQPGAAARMVRIGAGRRASPRFATVGRLTTLLRELLDDTEMAGRLEGLSAAVLRAGGTRRAVEIILDAVEGRVTADPQADGAGQLPGALRMPAAVAEGGSAVAQGGSGAAEGGSAAAHRTAHGDDGSAKARAPAVQQA